MLVFIAALHREIADLEPLVSERMTSKYGSAISLQGVAAERPVALVRSGIGRERSQAAVRELLLATRPRAIVAIGFAGGLAPDVCGGDLIVPRRIRGLTRINGSLKEVGILEPDPYLYESAIEALEDELIGVHTDELITVTDVMPGPQEKDQLPLSFRTKAVDMESYWIGELAREANVSFLSVRAASDEAEDSLPHYESFLDAMGDVRPFAAAKYYATHPWHIFEVPRLAVNARKGAKHLAIFAEAFIKKAYRAAPVTK